MLNTDYDGFDCLRAVANMYQGVLGLACRILDYDYVTGYAVDDDFCCVAFAMHAARVLLMLSP